MPRSKRSRFLFSPRRYFQKKDSAAPKTVGGWGKRQWIVSRSLCLYRRFVLEDVPPGEMTGALNLRIQQWSPFEETGRYVVWDKKRAHVWIWDEVLCREARVEAGVKKTRVLPETVLHPSREKGLYFISCLEGVEAQVWQDNRLMASRWWGESPTEDEWARFLLANDLNPNLQKLDPQEPEWLKRPWGRSSGGRARLSLWHERAWLYLGLAGFSFLLVWQGASTWKWRQAAMALEERAAALTAEMEPGLEARAKAMEALSDVEKLLALDVYPHQIQLMAVAAEKFPAKGMRLVEWRYNKGHLTFTVQGQEKKDLDPRYYVKAYQEVPFFKDVSAEEGSQPNHLVVETTVTPKKQEQ